MTAHRNTEAITFEEVMASVEACKRGLQTAAAQVVWQIENQVWLVTGHADWDEFREAYYDGIAVILPTDGRKELVPKLRATGMTQQQIAKTLGVNQGQVSRDLANMHMHIGSDQPTTITNSRGEERPATYRPRLTVAEPEQEEPEGGSVCFPDPSDGANLLKDILRGWSKALAPEYRYPTTKALDALDKWLARQIKLSEQARRKIT